MLVNNLFISSLIILLGVSTAFARVSILAPWGLGDRQATPARIIHHSVGFQFGVNGVTPPGSDTDSDFIAVPVHLTYGAADKIEVGAGWGPLNSYRKDQSSQFGISDLAIAGKYRFLEPNRQKRTPGLDVEAGFYFPTASFDKGLGTGALGIVVGSGLVLPLDPARVYFGMGFRWNAENSDNVQVGNVFFYNLGVTMPAKSLQLSNKSMESLSFTAELKGMNHAHNRVSGTNVGSAPDELYLSPGILWQISPRFEITSSLLIGLTADSSDIGMNLALRF